MRNPFEKEKKSLLRIKTEEVAENNPRELRAFLVEKGFRQDQLLIPYDLVVCAMYLCKKDKTQIPYILALHPDYNLFVEVKEKMNEEDAKHIKCLDAESMPPLVVIAERQPHLQEENNPPVVELMQEEQSKPLVSFKVEETEATQEVNGQIKEYEYFEVKDVCVLGIPLKVWLFGILALFVLCILSCLFYIKNND